MIMGTAADLRPQLLALAHDLGDARQMSILGEGNVSGKLDADRFLIKASGAQLSTLQQHQLVEVNARPILDALASGKARSDEEIEALLLAIRVDQEALRPSVETLFHAWLLSLPGVRVVGHCHAIAVNQILCSPHGREFASRHVIPEQIVCCGAEAVWIPYVDPGYTLARCILEEVIAFKSQKGWQPKTILLQNHGIIAMGAHYREVVATLAMAEKCARIFVGAAMLGGPVFMEGYQVRRIASRADEEYRKRLLFGPRN